MPRPIPISALQHYLFCPRQCALIHNEQVWAENQFTAEGQILHQKTNEGPDEHRSTGKILRQLRIKSEKYKLTGICDIVEILPDQTIQPVEYKRGKPKGTASDRKGVQANPDEVQVCAQALCLEEIFSTRISEGLIFYGKTRRRTVIPIDQALRDLTLATIHNLTELFTTEHTPQAEYSSKKCDNCSLIDLCLPHSMRLKRGAKSWFENQLNLTNEFEGSK